MATPRHPAPKLTLSIRACRGLRTALLVAGFLCLPLAVAAQTLTLAPEELETNFTGRAFEPLVTPDQLERIFEPETKIVPEAKLDGSGLPRTTPAAATGRVPLPGKATSGAENVDRKQTGLDPTGG